MQIHLLSGPVHSGKTTYLMNYAEQHETCSGILSPVIDGLRYFYDIASKEKRVMEANSDEQQILQIGKYRFSKSAFDWAEEKINAVLSAPVPFLIIDEIGPLELKGEGFSSLLFHLLEQKAGIENLLLVVRTSAVEEVCSYFKLDISQIKTFSYTPFIQL